jgi:hypothetical protein
MNGRDEFQTGVSADETARGADEGIGLGAGGTPAAVREAPGATDTAGTSTFDSSGVSTPPPLKTRPTNAPFGIQVPESVPNALAPLEPVGRQYLGWIGAALLLIGTFLSVKTYTYNGPNLGLNIAVPSASQNFWDFSGIWAFVVLVLALASAGLAFIRDYKWLLVTGGVSFVVLVVNLLFTFSGVLGLSARPSWGWIVLFLGALVVLAAGAMRSAARDAENPNALNNLIASVQSRSRSSNR